MSTRLVWGSVVSVNIIRTMVNSEKKLLSKYKEQTAIPTKVKLNCRLKFFFVSNFFLDKPWSMFSSESIYQSKTCIEFGLDLLATVFSLLLDSQLSFLFVAIFSFVFATYSVIFGMRMKIQMNEKKIEEQSLNTTTFILTEDWIS